MKQSDAEALQLWQSQIDYEALDRQVHDLDVLTDDILKYSLPRDGYRYLKSRRLKLQSISRKLELLVQDLQPETVTQWPIDRGPDWVPDNPSIKEMFERHLKK